MIKVAIIEDNDQDAESLINEISRYSKENKIDITYQRFSNPILFLDKYEPNFDVVFFDIMMPLMNGIEASKKLRKLDDEIIDKYKNNLDKYSIIDLEKDLSYELVNSVPEIFTKKDEIPLPKDDGPKDGIEGILSKYV